MAQQLEIYRTRRRAILRRGADPQRDTDPVLYPAYSEARYGPDGRRRQPAIRRNGRDSMDTKAVLPVDVEDAALCGPQITHGPTMLLPEMLAKLSFLNVRALAPVWQENPAL